MYKHAALAVLRKVGDTQEDTETILREKWLHKLFKDVQNSSNRTEYLCKSCKESFVNAFHQLVTKRADKAGWVILTRFWINHMTVISTLVRYLNIWITECEDTLSDEVCGYL